MPSVLAWANKLVRVLVRSAALIFVLAWTLVRPVISTWSALARSHFNPDWRSKFVHIANESIDKERDQEIILTTHSPYIVSDCRRECVYIFQRNPDGTVSQPKSPDINTFGTSIITLVPDTNLLTYCLWPITFPFTKKPANRAKT